jgi:BASS family bile acid:Na+ symporter
MLVLMVIPMVIGLLVRAKRPAIAEKIMGPVVWASYLMILVVLVTALLSKLLGPNPVGGLIDLFGTLGIFAIVLAVGISLILGYIFGGPVESIRRSLATGSAIRNAGMALLFAASIFDAVGEVLTVLVAFIIIQTLVVGLIAGMWRRRGAPVTA